MRVMVVGGSGFVGRAVVSELLARGHAVRVLTRGTRPRMNGVEWITGRVEDGPLLERACAGCDAVLYLAGIIAEVRDQTYDRVHREGTVRVLAAARATGVQRWIHMSALDTRAGAPSRYHATKWAGEEAVRQSGMAWTIHRPSVIHGTGDGFVGFFERMSRWSPILPLVGGGQTLFQPVWVGDVATAMVRCIEVRERAAYLRRLRARAVDLEADAGTRASRDGTESPSGAGAAARGLVPGMGGGDGVGILDGTDPTPVPGPVDHAGRGQRGGSFGVAD